MHGQPNHLVREQLQVQSALPDGGIEQATAQSFASSSTSSFAGAPSPLTGDIITFGQGGRVAIYCGKTEDLLVDVESTLKDMAQESDELGWVVAGLAAPASSTKTRIVVTAPNAGTVGTDVDGSTPLNGRGAIIVLDCAP
jgi:hypothetical protein